MKATLDCLECIAQQALRAARIATDDPETQRRILNEAVLRIPGMDINESPAVLSQFVYELAKQASGQEDPYADLKRAQNEQALALEPELRAYLAEAPDPLETALHLSAAGNVIDMGVHYAGDIDIHTAIRDALHQRFAVDHSRQFRESLAASRALLFLLDNAGEIVFDKLLIEQLCQFTAVTAVVKKAPIINDVTLEDAHQVGLTAFCPVIDNGGAFIGSPLSQIPPEFRQRLGAADMIVGKGQGNYETIDDFPGNVFLILKAKCEVIARHMGVRKGQVGLISTRFRNGLR
ncbi:MAG TPA: ARMT1-like domain-containing protein [Candidatus Hydrogenedentes bacterium]|nr:ARMT1-like domain-containing protein [FCB group bacterium]HNV22914.1 ARMT1-like domain-containing protein [Candidatus Hydrogenedentota bacterium]HPA03013.1 ARMT1-like domain-containing protein [Candidatus Hydrogenedentota bacterium]HPV37099.1 ARMT1-like domain-containing protein [Candidatus Hydrogenedentota bacterium]